ncbi:hypothetical protein EYF80_014637 [Liparis tanakae]|uniref:Secreted protein n=1 Tax=Liparis tanakae TaxID=230148 RepID=A0A4Z2ICH9_9TELE|nr:hypothetical protein EYF80_014637 [Liparis tanakae]
MASRVVMLFSVSCIFCCICRADSQELPTHSSPREGTLMPLRSDGDTLSQVSEHHTSTGWTERKRQTGNLNHGENPVYVAHDSHKLLEEGKGSVVGQQRVKPEFLGIHSEVEGLARLELHHLRGIT